MSPGLVTQLVADKPRIILVVEGLDTRFLQQEWAHQELELTVISPSALQSVDFEWPIEVYKVVWILRPPQLPVANQLWTKLKASPVPVVIVVLGVTPTTDARPLFTDWRRVSHDQQRFLSEVSHHLPGAPVILAQDVVATKADQLAPLSSMIQLLSTNVVIDPELTLYLQAWKSFCQSLARLVIRPGLSSSIVKGKKVTTSTLAKLIQLYHQRVVGTLPTIEVMSVQPTQISELPITENFAAHSLDDVANDLVTNLKQSQPSNTNASSSQSLPKPVKRPALIPASTSTPAATPTPVSTPAPPSAPAIEKPIQSPPTPTPVTARPAETDLDGEVARLFQSYRSEHKVKRVKNIAKTTVKTTKKNRNKSWLFKGGLVCISVALIVVSLVAVYLGSSWGLRRSVVQTLAQGSLSVPSSVVALASVVQWQNQLYGSIFDQAIFSQNSELAELVETQPQLQAEAEALTNLSQTAYLQVTGRADGSVFETASTAVVKAQALYELIAQNQARLKQIEVTDDPQTQSQILDYTEALNQQKKSLVPIQQVQPLLSQLLGAEGKRTYAVLFQNPQELRPTGGFIQSVALLTFEDGVLINTQVVSSYELDTRVAGAVQPPLDLSQLLGEQQWFFRDSNWQPDFPSTATQVAWFTERGLNQSVDGVIGLNTFVLRDVLRVVGPVELPEYNEIITDRNLMERLEFHSELQLVDPQKDYSTLLFNRILQKMAGLPAEKAPVLLDVLRNNFESKQLTMSLKDSAELLSFTTLGWSGALLSPACPAQLAESECVVDTVAQVEANVGINKANSYIDRTVDHQVVLTPEFAEHTRTMVFRNTATSNAWPKGTYKNYLRLYVPPTAELSQVSVDGTPLPDSQVITRIESDKRVFGFLVETPTQRQSQVTVKYRVPHQFSDQYAYALFNQQQPGIQTPPFTIRIEFPPELRPSLIAPQAEVDSNAVLFNLLPLPHSFVGIVFK